MNYSSLRQLYLISLFCSTVHCKPVERSLYCDIFRNFIMSSESSESTNPPEEKIVFKRKKQCKPLRQRIKTDDSDDENIEQVSSKLTEMRELQKLRERPNGVSIILSVCKLVV
ncbi:unnamed protein product [Callosobruchus maculatus]|uniref:Uncharacterized protein n=1 Tax=Callosobruchus maculatus TaxID=64391 RepID=A0A653DPM9_CALMS|nr:unnamed protein product [Callosobruchus maculatus]